MSDTVYVFDEKKNQWVEVTQNKDGSYTDKKGVTVKPGVKSGPVTGSNYVSTPYGAYKMSAPVVTENKQAVANQNKSKAVPTPVGMTSQAPGGWNPNSRFAALPGVRSGDTGDKQEPFDQASFITQLLSAMKSGSGSGGGGSKPTISSAALKKALTAAKNEISQAYDTAGTGIGQAFATNPYAGLQSQEATVDPGLNALFESQGVSPNALGQMVSANREAASQRQSGMGDLYKLLESNYTQNAAAQQAGIQAQRASSLNDLLQQYAAILGSGKVY